MPRRNLQLLVLIAVVSGVCYVQANSAHRTRYGQMFDTFTEILDKVEQRYVEPVEDRDEFERELFEGALRGMVGELDPHSAYIGPEEYGELKKELEQEFGGIGIMLDVDPQTKLLTVVTPLVGTPAFERGILAGDLILKIDGESTEKFQLDDARRLLRGKPGQPVTLTVLHKGAREPSDIEITRANIEVPSVLGDTRAADGTWEFFLPGHPGIGYVRITTFGEKTVEQLKAALEWLRERNVRGLILDLRNNSGGLLNSAVDTCKLFVSEGQIVSTRGRDGEVIASHQAAGGAPYADLPLVVLVNQYTASASEIVAGCLQDHQRATIVGQRSYGKGSVQDVIPLEGDRSGLKLTVATFWRPSGQNIHRGRNAKEEQVWGITPDEGRNVPLDDEQLAKVVRSRRDRDIVRPASAKEGDGQTVIADDPQLQSALEALEQRVGAAAKSSPPPS